MLYFHGRNHLSAAFGLLEWSLLQYGTLGGADHPLACTHVGAIPSGYGKEWNQGKRHCWRGGDIVCVSCLTGG